jgi:hypothetical protein
MIWSTFGVSDSARLTSEGADSTSMTRHLIEHALTGRPGDGIAVLEEGEVQLMQKGRF